MTRREDAAYTPQERAFLDAIERILAGKPKNPDLQPCAVGRKRQKLKLTVANMALEAGYARTYVYKNADAMARVMRRFEEVTKPRQPASTTADLLTRLRQDNARLKRERDLAIDVTRRWMQEADARNERIEALERMVERLTKENGARRAVVDFAGARRNGAP